MELPFELYKRHKYFTLNNWRKRCLIHEDIDELYNRYIYAIKCDWCAIDFKSSRDRCMDHCHTTGKFRGILCKRCNDNANESPNICWYKKLNKYVVQIMRERKHIYTKQFDTIEEAEAVLKQFKDDNWWYFPYHVPEL